MLKDLSCFRHAIFIAVSVVFLSFNTLASAQLSEEELRRERIETIEQLKSTEQIFGTSSRAGAALMDKYGMIFEYGGAASITYTGGSNNDRNESQDTGLDITDHNYDYELNLFGVLSDQARTSKLYVRLKTKYTEQKKAGVSAGAVRGNDYEQANFDMAYFEKKINSKFFKHTWTAGRQYISVGRGIAYGQVGDGLDYSIQSPKGRIESYEMFGVRQLPRDDNSDVYNGSSVRGAGHTHRLFYGGELKLRVAPRHKFTFYFVVNNDKNPESNPIAGLHRYDSKFLGYGLAGPIPMVPNLTYFGEYVTVRGKNYGRSAVAGSDTRTAVSAYAFDMGLKYTFAGNKYAPSMFVQYSGASGDPDRVVSVVGSTAATALGAGNTPGTQDNAFQGFGGLPLGYALAPTFSNIRAHQLGGSIKPWKDTRLFNNATLSVVFFNYWKDVTSAPFSDPFATADAPRGNIGGEWNISIKWKILSDFKSDLRYGQFRPGEVYGANRANELYIKYKFTVDL